MIIKKESLLRFFLVISVYWASFSGIFVFWTPLSEYGEFTVPRAVLMAGDIILFAGSVLVAPLIKKSIYFRNAFTITLIFILICTIASAKLANNITPQDYLHYFGRNFLFYFLIGLMAMAVSMATDPTFHEKFLDIYTIAFAGVSLVICILYFTGNRDLFWEGTRLTGPMINHNSFAFVCVFLLFRLIQKENYLLSSLYIGFIFLSGSATGMLSIAAIAILKPRVGLLISMAFFAGAYLYYNELEGMHFFYKIDQLFYSNETHLTSLSSRQDQYSWFVNNFLLSPSAWPLGVLHQNEFLRFDSQYYNIAVNFGAIALATLAASYYIYFRAIPIKSVRLFLVWAAIAMVMTAFLSRWNIIIIFFYILGYGISHKTRPIKHEPHQYS